MKMFPFSALRMKVLVFFRTWGLFHQWKHFIFVKLGSELYYLFEHIVLCEVLRRSSRTKTIFFSFKNIFKSLKLFLCNQCKICMVSLNFKLVKILTIFFLFSVYPVQTYQSDSWSDIWNDAWRKSWSPNYRWVCSWWASANDGKIFKKPHRPRSSYYRWDGNCRYSGYVILFAPKDSLNVRLPDCENA